MGPKTPFQLLGGETAVRELAEAFYQAMDALPAARDIRRMHGDNLDQIKNKLYEYLCGCMGGPPLYANKTGTVCATEAHKPYAIGPDERDQWLLCMDAAVEKVGACDEVTSMFKPALFRVADAVRNLDHCNRQPRNDSIIAIA